MQLLSRITRHHNERSQALLALTIASILWGITTPVLKWSLEGTPPFLFAFLRFLIAGVVFYAIARPTLKIQKNHIWILIISLFLGTSVHIMLAFYGIRLTTALNASFISMGSPFLTLVAGSLILREKMRKNLILGGLLGLVGMLFLVIGPFSDGNLPSTHIAGNLLLSMSIGLWIVYEIIAKKYLFPHYSVSTITFYAFVIGLVSVFPFAFGDLLKASSSLFTTKLIIGILFTSIFSSVFAFSLWQWGVSKIEVSRVGFFIYLDPVTSSILAIVLLGETFTPSIIFGTLFVLGGLYIAEKKIHFPHIHLFHHYRGKKLRT